VKEMATKLVYDAKTKTTQEVEFDFTPEKPRKFEIQERLQNITIELKETDYHALKFIEGDLTEEAFQPYKELRHKLRLEYNQLESELVAL
jgi:hypothetical protein